MAAAGVAETDGPQEAEVEALLRKLTSDEKVDLLSGRGMWAAGGVPRLGVPPLLMSDGPHGCRGLSMRGDDDAVLAPCETALAASFDEPLIREVGALLGQDTAARGVHMLLGPTLNMHRLPISGRHFECFSEDPFLSARAGVAYIRGVQEHAAACAKHFVGNDQESDRGTMNSVIDEQTLREVYLAPFEAAVTEAGVEGVMCGYNRLNGQYCTENSWLLTDVLRKEWGFQGITISDWFGNRSTLPALKAGLNVEMPGIEPRSFGGYLRAAVRAGAVPMDLLDARCRPVIRTVLHRDQRGAAPRSPPTLDMRRRLLQRAAAESLVLLKNEGGTLPLDPKKLKRVAILGHNAAKMTIQGGGSSRVRAKRCESLLAALRSVFPQPIELVHSPGCLPEYFPSSMMTPDMDGLMVMGSGDASGQPFGDELRAVMMDRVLAVGAWFSSSEVFRRCLMPLLRRLGFRLSEPAEAAAKAKLPPPPPADDPSALKRAKRRAALRATFLTGAAIAVAASLSQSSSGKIEQVMRKLAVLVAVAAPFAFGVEWRGGGAMARRRAEDDKLLLAAEQAAAGADAVVVAVGTNGWWEIEGIDQVHMRLPGRQDELVSRAVAAAKGPVVVVLNVGSPKELPWLESVPALLLSYFGGEEAASAIAAALVGDEGADGASPAGRLPTTWPAKAVDAPPMAAARMPRHDQGRGPGDTPYSEGLHLGYRGYGAEGPATAAPVFAFGHGLSYTRFILGGLSASLVAPCCDSRGPRAIVKAHVTNSGNRPGAEVLQVYVSTEAGLRTLCGFRRTAVLQPGEVAAIEFDELGPRALGAWYDAASGWQAPKPGEKVVLELGSSSTDVQDTAVLVLR